MSGTGFEIKYRDGLARLGEFSTPHGKVRTPTLLPVINPADMPVSPEAMKKIGAEMIITNSYIIYNRQELREKALENGVHSLVGDIPVMTDSGTFQMYVYGRVRVTNEEIIEFQRKIGTDVGTILDVFTVPGTGREKARKEAEETLKRARAGAAIKEDMALAGPVQGGIFPELREWHARELSKLDLDFHPIGGVVPLMENYRFRTLAEVIIAAKKGLTPSRPVHLFGAGHPMIFPLAAYLGCDFFDSSSYIKYARDGRMMFPDGTRRLEEIHESGCACPICSSFTAKELREMPEPERVKSLSLHNLYVSFAEIRRVRNAIKYGDLREMVEERLRVNPHLLPVFRVLKRETDFLEQFEPVSRRSAFFFTGPESLDRPIAERYYRRFFSRYLPSRRGDGRVIIGLEEGERPYSRFYAPVMEKVEEVADARFIVNSVFGPVPTELDEMYPIAQTVIPNELDPVTQERMKERMEAFSHALPPGLAVMWDGEETIEMLKMMGTKKRRMGKERSPEQDLERNRGKGSERNSKWDIERVKAVVDMQFGAGASAMLNGRVKIVKSRRTGKIRNVFVDGKHVLSMRAHDGLFTLKFPGAERLMKIFPPPALRVIVDEDAAEFCAKGKSVFARFVLEMDVHLRPMDEAIVVDQNDRLLAVGQVVLVREEALAFNRGIAVKVREGVEQGQEKKSLGNRSGN